MSIDGDDAIMYVNLSVWFNHVPNHSSIQSFKIVQADLNIW